MDSELQSKKHSKQLFIVHNSEEVFFTILLIAQRNRKKSYHSR